MKKTMILFVILFTAPAVWAKSTCEVRVDRHPNANTVERVEYCLNDSDVEDTRPKVISYSITTNTPKQQTLQESSTFRVPSRFDNKRVKVSRTYVETHHFPTLENDIQSEQERIEQEAKELEEEVFRQEERLQKKAEELPLPDDEWFDVDEEYFAKPGQPHKVKSVVVTPTTTTAREQETSTQVGPDGKTISKTSSSRVHGVAISGPRQTEIKEEITTTMTTVTTEVDRSVQVTKRLAKPGRVMGDSHPANTDPVPAVAPSVQQAESVKQANEDLANDFDYDYIPQPEPVVEEKTVETASETIQTQDVTSPVEETYTLDPDAFSEADALWRGN